MELGLSLGNASEFLENGTGKQQKSGLKNGGPDLSMGLSLNSCAVENQGRPQENDEDDDDGDDEISEGDGCGHYNMGEAPLQLNLLPLAPVPRRFSNHRSSENGSSGNMGLAAAKGRRAAEEVSSANSVGPPFHLSKRDFAGTGNDVAEEERASDDDENGALNRKKLRLSKQQSAFLEESFKEHNTLNPKQKLALAKQLNLRPRQVEVWFQNRRARTKLKQTEIDCEYLKKWCEKLSEENRRVHKELQELRALKTSSTFQTQLPATTLTMCPSCQRVTTTSAAAIPIPLNRSRFYPFSQTTSNPNQPAPS
ncbi:homeobox leucine zipper protein [Perilla frutescens var. hirtella]|uniref:Homeobox leucine zipper protein n=1 Tax=Perilla frutescens var. hirtella TaxID=608512 RepID=A0AAD4IN83_PERFH|nr:homeobox leucine zipper protein [Perilla frutescens var. hirtella]